MPEHQPYDVAVVVPTLEAGPALVRCLDALRGQTYGSFQVIVVDNSEAGLARKICDGRNGLTYLPNSRNLGFGAAVNRGFQTAGAQLLATLNDDAVAEAGWLAALVAAMQPAMDVGMCASKVVLEDGTLDSAGMLIAMDGSSRQRGHGGRVEDYGEACEVLFPSGSAALYRRDMLEQAGFFDESFFLYCEDSDLGLRGRWAGWRCRYVPEARVVHGYSRTAGRASPRKAYLVERNRLRLVTKNFPLGVALLSGFYALARYAWHVFFGLQGRGKAAEFGRSGNGAWRLPLYVLRAHGDFLIHLPKLISQRRRVERRMNSGEFLKLLRAHSIPVRQVAAL